MASVFVIKGKIENPKEWYSNVMNCDSDWKLDDNINMYHLGTVYMKEYSDGVSFEDSSENDFFGWETSAWISLADGNELIYGHYNDDNCIAEFIHIKDGKCIREYREYDSEVDTDEGNNPEFDDWVDVASYVDKYLL